MVVGTPRGKYLMLQTPPRTLHVHDDIPHLLHCMAYTSRGDASSSSNKISIGLLVVVVVVVVVVVEVVVVVVVIVVVVVVVAVIRLV